ncbi:L-aspartate oxidase [Brevibacterium marinum]|uniref:L-aspartate oxidase n=1 Tax=Brevibacterium marinum TaxID=418643 RepID=A0A846RZH2_9MICO|nr:L-aspartate oxidase [Brevibacterium marinum]NJC56590.1 L-aspartate oxidase [Brevibacterium marinum]
MSHVLIIGTGIAGLSTALRLAGRHEVTVVTKDRLGDSNTTWAQGGIAGVLGADDTVGSHIADTLSAGAGLSDAEAVRLLCTEGPERILELAAAGVAFDRDDDGHWARGLEGAHSFPRILHAGGDATGEAIIEALTTALRAAVAVGTVRLLDHTMLLDLVTSLTPSGTGAGRKAAGVQVLRDGIREQLFADAVVLATGGAGQLYAHTTNPAAATGDGLAAAIRAGAAARDMEFYQFHPTALAGSGFLISEAVRGAGAFLLDAHGQRFMPEVDRRGELAPRDVVARAIHRRMAVQDGLPCYLNARSVPEVSAHFPNIARVLAERGFDLTSDLIPVTPAAHYFMGGIATDVDGRTSLPGLFAVGEVACTGVHGANRLASNSLLEGVVFSARAAEAVDADLETTPATNHRSWAPVSAAAPRFGSIHLDAAAGGNRAISRGDLQTLAWAHLGVERDGQGLRSLLERLGEGGPTHRTADAAVTADDAVTANEEPTAAGIVEEIESANLALIAQSIASHALARRESRGAHTRSDFPAHTTPPLQEAASC